MATGKVSQETVHRYVTNQIRGGKFKGISGRDKLIEKVQHHFGISSVEALNRVDRSLDQIAVRTMKPKREGACHSLRKGSIVEGAYGTSLYPYQGKVRKIEGGLVHITDLRGDRHTIGCAVLTKVKQKKR